MRSLPFLALLFMAGCSSRPPQNVAEQQCLQQAYQDPQVKAAIVAASPGTYNKVFNKDLQDPQEVARAAVRKATLDCLQKRGDAIAGGVEPVKQYPFSSLGF